MVLLFVAKGFEIWVKRPLVLSLSILQYIKINYQLVYKLVRAILLIIYYKRY